MTELTTDSLKPHLADCGYADNLVATDYEFLDGRSVDLAACCDTIQ